MIQLYILCLIGFCAACGVIAWVVVLFRTPPRLPPPNEVAQRGSIQEFKRTHTP